VVAIAHVKAGESGAAAAAQAFYGERLAAAGWTDEMPGRDAAGAAAVGEAHAARNPIAMRVMRDGGFVHVPDAARLQAGFHAPDGQHHLSVQTAPAPDGRGITILLSLATEVRIGSPRERAASRAIFAILPALRPPEGMTQSPAGGGGGPDWVHTSAWVEGEVLLAAVREHYVRALLEAGWSLANGGEGGAAAWSRWTLRAAEDDARWGALLLIVRCAEPANRFDLILRAHRVRGIS
jgi:hypothetical protein